MIELTVYNFLNNSEDIAAPVYMEVPSTHPASYYIVEKTGSSMSNHIYSSTLAIKSYGGSLYEAASLNEILKNVMLNDLLEDDSIASVELNSDYNYTDTTTKQYRYQAVFDIVHY